MSRLKIAVTLGSTRSSRVRWREFPHVIVNAVLLAAAVLVAVERIG